jgi:hypothetical protein
MTGQGPTWTPPPAGPMSGGGGVIGPLTSVSDPGSAAPVLAGVSLGGAALSGTPAGLVLTPASLPVGRPSNDGGSVTPGPAGPATLAAIGSGVAQGLGPGQGLQAGRQTYPTVSPAEVQVVDVEDMEHPVDPDAPPVDGALVVARAARPTPSDDMVIAAADWITRFGRDAYNLLSNPSDGSPEARPMAVGDSPEMIARDEGTSDNLRGVGRVEQAHFDAPVIVGVMSVLAMRYHQPMIRWLRRAHGNPTARRAATAGPPLRGPYRKI